MVDFYYAPERDDEPEQSPGAMMDTSVDAIEPLWLALTHDEALDLYIKLAEDNDFIDIRNRLGLLLQHGPKLRLIEDD